MRDNPGEENPEELVSVLTKAQADAIISRLDMADYKGEDKEPTLLVTFDTVVGHRGIIREKPSRCA